MLYKYGFLDTITKNLNLNRRNSINTWLPEGSRQVVVYPVLDPPSTRAMRIEVGAGASFARHANSLLTAILGLGRRKANRRRSTSSYVALTVTKAN
jgi:hypothetical protein